MYFILTNKRSWKIDGLLAANAFPGNRRRNLQHQQVFRQTAAAAAAAAATGHTGKCNWPRLFNQVSRKLYGFIAASCDFALQDQ
jgi:hypothetical protein